MPPRRTVGPEETESPTTSRGRRGNPVGKGKEEGFRLCFRRPFKSAAVAVVALSPAEPFQAADIDLITVERLIQVNSASSGRMGGPPSP